MGPAPTYRLPYQSVIIDQPRSTAEAFLRCETLLMAGGTAIHGFISVDQGDACDVLLLYGGAIHSAVRLLSSQVESLDVVAFFERALAAHAGRMRVCRTDSGLLLLMAVAFQNTPVVKASAAVADLARVLDDVAARKSAAVVLFCRGRDRNFAYCRDGQPVAAFFANRADVPRAATIRDQIVAYGASALADTSVQLFYDLHSRRDDHASRSFEDLLAGRIGPPEFLLTVMHGTERVQRRLLQGGNAMVGRDPANDITVEHPSVSRHHCSFQWRGRAFWVHDAGSANGTQVNGVRVTEQLLNHGDRITIGEFDILFGSGAQASSEHELRTVFLEPDPEAGGKAQLIRNGESTPVDGTVFKIGKSADAQLRLGGLFMKPIQATLVREAPGVYRLLAVSGGRAVRIGGRDLPAGGVLLESGTAIRIGGHQLVFVLTDGSK